MDIIQEIKRLEEEIKKTPYNKATEHHIGRLKAKLARLKEELEKQRQKKSKAPAFSLRKEGDASVFLVGFPSVGKSTLLNALTNAKSEVGDYDFTTLKPVPGMLEYKGAKIQIVDVPGLIEGASKGKGRGREVLSFIRNADLIVIVVDVFTLHNIDIIKRELYEAGIRLNQKPPEVVIKKRERGGIKITSTVPLSLDESTIVEVLKENRIHNAEVIIREDLTLDRLIDAIMGNRVYIPSITVVNKIDLYQPELPEDVIPISAERGINLDRLKEEIYRKLDFIRIYLKPPGGKPDFDEPLIMRRGCTVADVCKKLHRGMLESFRYAKVWGKSVKYQGQRVGLDHVLEDEDILTIYA
ncbi:OBG GTPase family GTP-binding protein [Archaeoglobus profundus]|uniref:Small GTP-binding protein n=1 Tax=Archaeoglobus profundus (strain DSM 5631 / JCM 9629 / NBRC 100127 / Av18) TaxID=572546 RepID=D2RG08_ARCPA|nr:GTP-binding protein [Archaeoglobus profundus]ADB57233.1 small GTP-binding protein [Archaeoglobus profundus DSM 5631]